MPATEETFRSQRTLHIVFGVSSLLMAVVLFWMIMADHLRPWKNVQREFQKIETDKIKVAETEKIELLRETNQNRLDSIDAAMAAATARAEGNASAIRDLDAKIRNLEGRREKLDTERKFQKAELDSQISLYDGMIDRGELRQARNYITSTIRRSEANLRRVTLEFEAVKQELADARLRKNLLAANEAEVTTPPPPGTAAAKAGFQMGDVLSVPEFESLMQSAAEGKPAKVAVKRKDGQAASLTLEYAPVGGESDAPGEQLPIELAGVLVTPVTSEVLTTRREDLTRDRDRLARQLDQKNRQYGEGDLWNQVNAAFRGLPILDLAAPPTKIQQISLPDLFINYNFKQVPRYDRCTTCHQGIDRIGYDHTAADEPMPAVFRNHPKLTEGARAIDLKTGKEVDVGLYLDANGPHPINQFGCTICHAGQGSGTDFTFSSHEPNDLEQKEAWVHEYQWREMHHWDEKMLPTRFMQSSCLKCHHQVTDIPRSEAPKLLAGFDRIVKYGCTGCHAIGSPGSVGPSLTDNRPVGPNLRHVGSKVSAEWLAKWIRNPHAFRPDTRMPRFYDLTNNDHSVDQPKVEAEVHAMAHYLVQKSTPPPHFIENLPTPGDGAMGKELFLQKGCLACHAHSEFPPSSYPEAIQKYAKADFGPNLSNLAAKFPSPEHGTKWLANWIHAPEHYHAKTLMPNLQLSLEDSTHIAAWLVSLPASWPTPVELDAKDSPTVLEGLDSLVKLYISKSKVYNERTILLSEVDSTVASLSLDEKLMYLGEKTIGRLGCFGCHNIAGFETAKPIGTPLDGWGAKHPSKLDFAHITEYLDDHAQRTDEGVSYDGTDPYYQEKLVEHTRMGFLYQKLHRPRSYDYRKDRDDLKSWDDRLRMPQFTWANDPAAVEEVMTFILGLTGEFIPGKYLPNYGPEKLALAQGEKLVERFNCKGCHVLRMPRYSIAAGTDLDKVFKAPEADDPKPFETNVTLSYQRRATDYLSFFPGLTFDPAKPPVLEPSHTGRIVLEGMPVGEEFDEDENGKKINRRLFVQLWEPVAVRGYTFGISDTVILDPDQVHVTDADGGDFAWLYAGSKSETPGDYTAIWNRLPPPLVREGLRVQTPWLMNFLQDPYLVRPAAGLRMPRFHWGYTPGTTASAQPDVADREAEVAAGAQPETRDLANYFAARDRAEFPYQNIPERDQAYLSQMESQHKNYLSAGWSIMTKGLCIQCHAIGPHKPTGGEQVVNGPELRQVRDRFRPDYLFQWLGQPHRLVPYTAMPQNVPPNPQPGQTTPGVPPTLENKPLEQVRAMRDTLLNYVDAVEQQLADTAAPATAPASVPPAAGAATDAAKPGAGEE